MEKTDGIKLVSIMLVLAILLSLQLQLRERVPSFGLIVLTLLAIAPFLLSFPELLMVLIFAVALLNWQPGVDVEIVAAAAFPVLIFVVRDIFPVKEWLIVLAALITEGVVYYGVLAVLADSASFSFPLAVVVPSLAMNGIFGLCLFFILRYVYSAKN